MTTVYSTAEVAIPDDCPQPTGYRILIVMPKVDEKTKGGVLLPADLRNREDVASIIGKVVTIGPDAYPDTDAKFSKGAWCEVGDWVMLSKYSGHRFECDGCEMRIVNDDAIIGVVSDPTKIARAHT
tara:strand:+ start:2368 stop:2745 length:378 start_codon:yes stop_codon:yes gene_type:complete